MNSPTELPPGGQPSAANGSGKDDGTQTSSPAPAGAGPQPTGDFDSLVSDHAKGFDGFDPAVHAVGPDGRPVAKKGGGWQKKRGGNMRINAAPGSEKLTSTAAPDAPIGAVPKPQTIAKVNTLEAAKSTLNAITSLMVLIFGEHWAPQSEQERAALVGATKNYFDAKGAVEVSPGWGLVLVAAAYSVPRLRHEATRSKLASIKVGMYRGYLWVTGLFTRRTADVHPIRPNA